MAHTKNIPPPSEPTRERSSVRAQLDPSTVITLSNVRALERWKKRYPMAVIIG